MRYQTCEICRAKYNPETVDKCPMKHETPLTKPAKAVIATPKKVAPKQPDKYLKKSKSPSWKKLIGKKYFMDPAKVVHKRSTGRPNRKKGPKRILKGQKTLKTAKEWLR